MLVGTTTTTCMFWFRCVIWWKRIWRHKHPHTPRELNGYVRRACVFPNSFHRNKMVFRMKLIWIENFWANTNGTAFAVKHTNKILFQIQVFFQDPFQRRALPNSRNKINIPHRREDTAGVNSGQFLFPFFCAARRKNEWKRAGEMVCGKCSTNLCWDL